MTKSGNGYSKELKADDLTVFEPAFTPGNEEEEKIGYFKTDSKGEEGEIVQELPQEITGEPSTQADEENESESDS